MPRTTSSRSISSPFLEVPEKSRAPGLPRAPGSRRPAPATSAVRSIATTGEYSCGWGAAASSAGAAGFITSHPPPATTSSATAETIHLVIGYFLHQGLPELFSARENKNARQPGRWSGLRASSADREELHGPARPTPHRGATWTRADLDDGLPPALASCIFVVAPDCVHCEPGFVSGNTRPTSQPKMDLNRGSRNGGPGSAGRPNTGKPS